MTLDNGTDGQTDRRTDRVRRNMQPPPREEGRIIIIIIIIIIRAFVRRTMSASELNLRRRQSLGAPRRAVVDWCGRSLNTTLAAEYRQYLLILTYLLTCLLLM